MSRVPGEAGYQGCGVTGPHSSRMGLVILKAKTRGVQWGGLLEERWFLVQVSHPSLHHKTVSILYGTELSGVRNVGIEVLRLCPLKGGRWWSGPRAQGSIPGRQHYCLLGSFKWSCVCVCVCVCECMLSRVQLFVTPWTVAQGFPGKNTGVGCHLLLQAIFPTQGSDPCLLH